METVHAKSPQGDIHQVTSLPISASGDISPSLPKILVSPSLSTNLIFVDQFLDHNYNVQFSCSSCVVQDCVWEDNSGGT